MSAITEPFDRFQTSFGSEAPLDAIRAGIIGKGVMIPGPFGPRPLRYADYVASGRALRQVEDFVLEQVLPFYANSHTESSYCGAAMNRLRRAARAYIGAQVGADPDHAVVFCGAGATAGLNRLVHLLGVADAVARGEKPLIVLGPYEHHSNILPWRESGAEVVMVDESPDGGPDMDALEKVLGAASGRLVVGAFSAASNVTGQRSDVPAISRLLRRHGARVVWDYAGAGPYLPIDMTPAPDAAIDAIVVSPHKFVGGPGASGVMVVRRDAVTTARPSLPGGGTVRFVSAATHDYAEAIEAREEAGTPNVIGDIRAALAFAVKAAVGTDAIMARNAVLLERARAVLGADARIGLLGRADPNRLAFLSFTLRDGRGAPVHYQLATRLLSDLHGVQARGGCACAGPYVMALLGIDAAAAARMRGDILAGRDEAKPGFVRLNLCHLLDDDEADAILHAVLDVAERAPALAPLYDVGAGHAVCREPGVMAAE